MIWDRERGEIIWLYRYNLSGFSCVWLFVTLWTVACQAPLSMRFSRQGYWSGLPFPSPGYLPNPGSKPESPESPALAGRFFTTSTTWVSIYNPFRVCLSICPLKGFIMRNQLMWLQSLRSPVNCHLQAGDPENWWHISVQVQRPENQGSHGFKPQAEGWGSEWAWEAGKEGWIVVQPWWLDEAHLRWRASYFPESTDSNADLIWKHSHRHPQK